MMPFVATVVGAMMCQCCDVLLCHVVVVVSGGGGGGGVWLGKGSTGA
jgi:hypothetical protein